MVWSNCNGTLFNSLVQRERKEKKRQSNSRTGDPEPECGARQPVHFHSIPFHVASSAPALTKPNRQSSARDPPWRARAPHPRALLSCLPQRVLPRSKSKAVRTLTTGRSAGLLPWVSTKQAIAGFQFRQATVRSEPNTAAALWLSVSLARPRS